MLSILGRGTRMCDGTTRRELLRAGGCTLLGGLTLPWLLQAEDELPTFGLGPAKSVIFVNLLGGPSHIDTFDMKPDSPAEIRGEFRPIATTVPGLQICELLPRTAQRLHHATLIRSHSHLHNSHNPYNVLTGYDGGNDAQNYFSKRTDHPSMASVSQYFDPGPTDVPRYVTMPAFPGYNQALRRAGPYGGYLGSQFDPLFTVCDPTFKRETKDDYDPVEAIGHPTPPSLDALPGLTANRFDRRRTLLAQFDRQLATVERQGAPQRMNKFKQQALELLSSSKTRTAFDISREPDHVRDAYGRNLWGSSLVIARRLVEAGSRFVTVHWESRNGNHWDMHGNTFKMLRVHLPQLDLMIEGLILDLEARGLLDETLVVVMGEMGRTPKINAKSGRDHWPQCGFSLLFGGGTQRGMVLGATDYQAAYPVDRPVSAGDMAATIYQLIGINPALTVPDLGGRPVHISHGGQPVWEVLA